MALDHQALGFHLLTPFLKIMPHLSSCPANPGEFRGGFFYRQLKLGGLNTPTSFPWLPSVPEKTVFCQTNPMLFNDYGLFKNGTQKRTQYL
jgi:hypothetical protein